MRQMSSNQITLCLFGSNIFGIIDDSGLVWKWWFLWWTDHYLIWCARNIFCKICLMKIEAKQMVRLRIKTSGDVKCFSGSHSHWILGIVATIMMWRVQFHFEIIRFNHTRNHPWSLIHNCGGITNSIFSLLSVENC